MGCDRGGRWDGKTSYAHLRTAKLYTGNIKGLRINWRRAADLLMCSLLCAYKRLFGSIKLVPRGRVPNADHRLPLRASVSES